MRIWVDADACPKAIKEVLYRAANRTQTMLTLVANQMLSAPPSAFITKMQVEAGFDVADNKIVQMMEAGDIVITADIPLADLVIAKGGVALNPRGELYSEANIKTRLAVRNVCAGLRDSGVRTGGPSTLGKKEVQEFAKRLDGLLARR